MTTSPLHSDADRGRRKFANDPELLSGVLRPYARPKTQYLKSATVDTADGLAIAEGQFSIPHSCYIDDTGHLNSVEVNICFNQLMYYLIAKCVQEQALPAFDAWTMEDYWAKQLPDMLIANFRSNFRRPIDSASFTGAVSFGDFSVRNVRRAIQLVDMPWQFWDASGGHADGEVRMALVEPPGMGYQANAA